MEKNEAIETIYTELTAGIRLTKCQQCGCMRGALEAITGQVKGVAKEEANLLAENITAWSGSMKEIRYACLGCGHCYAAVAENAFMQAFPEATLPSARVCDFNSNQENWPPVIGEYYVLDKTAPVAVSTLGSVQLADTLARMNPPGMAVVGKTETENIGIDKIVRNLATNPTIKFLIVAGNESQGHLSGDALIALAKNGVDDRGRVINASGKRPVLRNVSFSEIETFRNQVRVIDLRGCEDAEEISRQVAELSSKGFQPCGCAEPCGDDISLNLPTLSVKSQSEAVEVECSDSQCGCHTQTRAFATAIIASDFDQNIALDRAGYFVILPVADRNIINVEHYGYDNTLLHVMEGPNARGLYLSIIREGWVTDLNHAAYLGKELAKAELSLKLGFNYLQDGA